MGMAATSFQSAMETTSSNDAAAAAAAAAARLLLHYSSSLIQLCGFFWLFVYLYRLSLPIISSTENQLALN